MARLSSMESEYEKVKNALSQVRARGYGIVMPHRSEIVLEEPELIRHGNKYGIKIHAQAPSINLIKAHIETEIAPIVGERGAGQGSDRLHKEKRPEGGRGYGRPAYSGNPWSRSWRTAWRPRSPR